MALAARLPCISVPSSRDAELPNSAPTVRRVDEIGGMEDRPPLTVTASANPARLLPRPRPRMMLQSPPSTKAKASDATVWPAPAGELSGVVNDAGRVGDSSARVDASRVGQRINAALGALTQQTGETLFTQCVGKTLDAAWEQLENRRSVDDLYRSHPDITSCRRCCVVTDRALSVSPSLRERAVNRRRVRQR